ncbi:MAG TPA: hypothetical protein VG165_06685 [Solirubrobacteraceae bacterium]|nr:hypothetical protein [Solirubrobacteraceae bacterium]
MKYMLLIDQCSTPVPPSDAWDALTTHGPLVELRLADLGPGPGQIEPESPAPRPPCG